MTDTTTMCARMMNSYCTASISADVRSTHRERPFGCRLLLLSLWLSRARSGHRISRLWSYTSLSRPVGGQWHLPHAATARDVRATARLEDMTRQLSWIVSAACLSDRHGRRRGICRCRGALRVLVFGEKRESHAPRCGCTPSTHKRLPRLGQREAPAASTGQQRPPRLWRPAPDWHVAAPAARRVAAVTAGQQMISDNEMASSRGCERALGAARIQRARAAAAAAAASD